MGSIEKPLSATSGFEYLSNDKPILSRHYSASVLLPVKEVSAGRDEPACVGLRRGQCKKNKQRTWRYMIFTGLRKCVCEVEAVFVRPYAQFARRKCAEMTFAVPVRNDYRRVSLA